MTARPHGIRPRASCGGGRGPRIDMTRAVGDVAARLESIYSSRGDVAP